MKQRLLILYLKLLRKLATHHVNRLRSIWAIQDTIAEAISPTDIDGEFEKWEE